MSTNATCYFNSCTPRTAEAQKGNRVSLSFSFVCVQTWYFHRPDVPLRVPQSDMKLVRHALHSKSAAEQLYKLSAAAERGLLAIHQRAVDGQEPEKDCGPCQSPV